MFGVVRRVLDTRKWARWNNTPKDVVILHTFGKAIGIPSGSPFVMKLQTYLRMAQIQHKTDSKDMLGPKGKAPWISLNGVHMGDSELIIHYLNNYFKVDLNKDYSPSQVGVAVCARVTLEEHFMWGMAMERFVYNPEGFPKVIGFPPLHGKLFMTGGKYTVQRRARAQGMGLHSKNDVELICSKDLTAVSNILGSNQFLLGQRPCQEDCAVFGMLAVVLWGLPNSPYQKLIRDDLRNLGEYCERMKQTYYPDWERCIRPPGYVIGKSSSKKTDSTGSGNESKSKIQSKL